MILEKSVLLPAADVIINSFYLMGIRIDGSRPDPDFYTYMLDIEGDVHPLLHEGRIHLFEDIQQGVSVLHSLNIMAEFPSEAQKSQVYILDVAGVLFLLQKENTDTSQKIANLLDFFARSLSGLGVPLPPVFDILATLGPHVDQDPYFGDFLNSQSFGRERAIDGVRWCLGTLMSLAKITR